MNWLLLDPLRPFIAAGRRREPAAQPRAAGAVAVHAAGVRPRLREPQHRDAGDAERADAAGARPRLLHGPRAPRALARGRPRARRPLSPQALAARADGRGRAAAARRRAIGCATSRSCATFSPAAACRRLFDAPWLPIYLLVIACMHPLLGVAAAARRGGCCSRSRCSPNALRAAPRASALQPIAQRGRHVEALTRNAEVIVGMGMLGSARRPTGAHARRAARTRRTRLGAASARLAALAPHRCARSCRWRCSALGAWLVVGARCLARHHGRGHDPARPRAAAGRAADRRLEGAGRRARRLAAAAANALRCASGEQRCDCRRRARRLSVERVSLRRTTRERPPLIKGVSFDARRRARCLGIVGPSASGKTTLAAADARRLRSRSAGTVRLDGADLAQLGPRAQLGAHLGYLPQDVELFAGTVAHNIARLGALDSRAVVAAAQLAQRARHDPAPAAGLRHRDRRRRRARSRAASGSASRWRARCTASRGWWCSTSPTPTSTPKAKTALGGGARRRSRLAGTTVVLVRTVPALMRHADRIAVLRDGTLDIVGPRDEVLARLNGRTVHRALRRARLAATSATAQGARA